MKIKLARVSLLSTVLVWYELSFGEKGMSPAKEVMLSEKLLTASFMPGK